MSGKLGRRVVVFDDFSKGEFGALGSWNAPKGSFTGQNVVRYIDGSLGPRNGLKALTVTGLPASGFGNRMGINENGQLWFQVGTLVKTIDVTDTSSQAAQPVGDAGVTLNQAVYLAGYVYAITSFSGIKKLDFGIPAITSVAGSPNGSLLIQYGERTLAAGDAAQPQRLYYSAAGDPNSWPASNYIDIGTGTTIKAILPLRSGVAIYTIGSLFTGIDGRWWILSGVPGVNEALREVLRGAQGPSSDLDAALLGDGLVAFAASKSEMVGLFDGSTIRLLRHLAVGTPPVIDVRSVLPLREEDDALILSYAAATPSSAVGLVRRDRSWTKHTFNEADVTHTVISRDGVLGNSLQPVTWAQQLVVFVTTASPPVFYIWAAYNDRPPFAGDYSAGIPAAADVHFTLPDIPADRGEQISVRKVTVWFRDWNTGGSPNQFSVNVTPIRQSEAGDGTTQVATDRNGATPSFSRPANTSSTNGTNLRRDFLFAADYGDAARLKISDMRGVAIHRIEAELETRPDPA